MMQSKANITPDGVRMTERLVGRPAGSTSHFGEAYIGSPISSMHDSWRMRIDPGLELRWKNLQRYGSSTTTLFSSSVKSEKLGNIELQAGGAECSDDLGLEEGEFDPRAGEAGNDFGARDGEWEGLRAGRDERNDVLGLEEGEYDPRDGEEGLVSRDRDLGFEEGVYDSRDHEGVFDVSDRDRGGEKFGKDELQVNRDERNVQFGLEEGKCVESYTRSEQELRHVMVFQGNFDRVLAYLSCTVRNVTPLPPSFIDSISLDHWWRSLQGGFH
ncbi:hypothetical protein R1sor_017349 [Riccia sorocarpa]|uniref:Uncharacterized protein n=1 Tax=Riccia sorocarpa TaxID=122646 RepID=A0ABD3IAM2_9MARC